MRDATVLMLAGLVLLLCATVTSATAQTFSPIQSLPEPSSLPAQSGFPDPLVMLDGRKVEDRQMWERERRPELKRLFQHYMYGYMPGRPKKIEAVVEREDGQYFGGKATKREVMLKVGPEGTRPIYVLLVLPNKRTKPAPVFVGIAFVGNYAVVNDPTIPVAEGWMYPNRKGVVKNRATEAGRGSMVDTWNIERTIDRGYGVALFYNGDVEPDDKSSTEGVRHRILRKGKSAHDPLDWGAVAAWAWGSQRVVDYLANDRDVDRKRIAVVGHSRNGKAALLAGAFDERISLVIPLQAGCGGTAPSRGTVGESVRQINTSFPHWFNANFKAFNDGPDLLPFDQHALVALCAPRPVLFANAEQDTWANPAGQFEVLKAADPVYRLLGVEGISTEAMPPMNTLVTSRLGYFIRPGEHAMQRVDWDAFLDYADAQWGKRR
jgi:hypothetical protein